MYYAYKICISRNTIIIICIQYVLYCIQICIVRGCSTSLLQSGAACRACEVQRMKCRPPVVVVVGDGLSMSLKENTVAFKHTCVAACGLWWWTTPTHSGSSSHLTHPAYTEFSGGAAIEARAVHVYKGVQAAVLNLLVLVCYRFTDTIMYCPYPGRRLRCISPQASAWLGAPRGAHQGLPVAPR